MTDTNIDAGIKELNKIAKELDASRRSSFTTVHLEQVLEAMKSKRSVVSTKKPGRKKNV